MPETIFTKILNGEIPSYRVYEDDTALAFLDINPIAKGHTLVIPKKSAMTVFELSESDMTSLMVAVKNTMQKIQAVLNPDGFTVGWNHNRAGGQAIDHVHVHVLPRWHGDGGGSMHSVIKNAGDLSVSEVAKLFSKMN